MPPDRRPLFARDFPRVPALDSLVDAFERGDYAHVRAEGPKLADASQEQEEVRRAARTLVRRTGPDPLSVWLIVLTGALLVAMSAYWIVQGQPPPAGAHDAPQDHRPSEHVR